ncbi:unnamed protein product [Tilletia controversa]|uniref:Uncharacterized protein n=3 Tax=Tilletia TaxID=13289 RepID=A0A8X7N1L5_9BASI|nr:hypothetical protein CF336_g808 [Tilletia laevis]KAE8205928.1 hypothetical protein CF328_g199 [Tilletia controversa]KAE8264466.1 hypothetical protein A4X03_0g925 [Tilletia caries]KAE8208018.1 hypothetical protein CF335_g720 [Tilletia laevis]KAE8255618.1 hypothetical protein A4X06_0g345 [Tilletia controversa]
MGAGPRYPYPKEVWSPAGGWWTRPTNWASNTAVCVGAIGVLTYGLWSYSADREWRHRSPTRAIPSMLWSRQFREGELKVKEP